MKGAYCLYFKVQLGSFSKYDFFENNYYEYSTSIKISNPDSDGVKKTLYLRTLWIGKTETQWPPLRRIKTSPIPERRLCMKFLKFLCIH